MWILKTGEPLPIDGRDVRLFRSGGFALHLVRAGHEVVWWTASFDHRTKRHRYAADTAVEVSERYKLWLLYSPGYRKHISWRRLRDHRILADHFSALAKYSERPDVIHCAYPTIDLSLAAVKYGQRYGVPVILDVRDMWPDLFVDVAPVLLRPLARMALWGVSRKAKQALKGATAISGHAPGFVAFGVRRAGRSIGSLDRHFPFTYDVSPDLAGKSCDGDALVEDLKSHIDNTALNICFFGTMSGENLHDDYRTPMQAILRLAAQGKRLRLILCGAGKLNEQLRQEFHGSDEIRILGWLSRSSILELMRQSQLGLIPYKVSRDFSISIPNKAVEYLAGGLPILTSLNHGYLFDLVSKNECGIFYEAGDVEGLMSKLSRVLESKTALLAMARNARMLFEREFRPENVFGAMESHLCEVVKAYKQ